MWNKKITVFVFSLDFVTSHFSLFWPSMAVCQGYESIDFFGNCSFKFAIVNFQQGS